MWNAISVTDEARERERLHSASRVSQRIARLSAERLGRFSNNSSFHRLCP